MSINRSKDPPTWLMVATTLEKPPTPPTMRSGRLSCFLISLIPLSYACSYFIQQIALLQVFVFISREQNAYIYIRHQCIRQISHNAPFCKRNIHTCALLAPPFCLSLWVQRVTCALFLRFLWLCSVYHIMVIYVITWPGSNTSTTRCLLLIDMDK